MIQAETVMINDKKFMHTYSTVGCYIKRDGVRYADAIDPLDSGRTYTETNIPVEVDETEVFRTAYNIVAGQQAQL
nr:MAG TPA: hypothetical protein [Caudoviricetes sp.]